MASPPRGDGCRQGLGRGSGGAGVPRALSEVTARLPAPPALQRDGQSPRSWPLAPCPFPGAGRNLPSPLSPGVGREAMGCTYSSPRDEPTLRRLVSDVSDAAHTDAPREGPLAWAGSPWRHEGAPCGADQQSRVVPGGLTGFVGPPVSWVLVCKLHSLLPKEEIWTGNQEGPSRRLPGLGKSRIQVHWPVWSRPAGSGRLRALRCGPTWTASELCHPEPSSQAWWGRDGGRFCCSTRPHVACGNISKWHQVVSGR